MVTHGGLSESEADVAIQPDAVTSRNNSTQYLDVVLRKWQMASAPPAEFDNFLTPENKFFYSRAPYMRLDPKRKEIRLLRILSYKKYEAHIQDSPQWRFDNDTANELLTRYKNFGPNNLHDEIIACELIDKIPLSSINGSYCTLSYCAGSPSKVKPLLIDGVPFRAFENLEHAIQFLHQNWKARYPSRELLVWVDQVCINQQDHVERAQQVAMMQDIYRRCDKTFVCLSTPDAVNCLTWIPPACFGSSTDDIASKFQEQVHDQLIAYNSFSGLPKRAGNLQFGDWIAGFEQFSLRPWWKRAWVYQEFVISPRVDLFSHDLCIDWRKLSTVLQYIFYSLESYLSKLLTEASNTESEHRTRREAWEAEREAEWSQKFKEQEEKYAKFYQEKISEIEKRHSELSKSVAGTSRLRVSSYRKLRDKLGRTEQELMMWRIVPANSGDLGELYDNYRLSDQIMDIYRNLRKQFPIPSKSACYELQNPEPKLRPSVAIMKSQVQDLLERLRDLDMSPARTMVGQKLSSKRCLDLKVHLDHSRNCLSSDPRDRIYAFVGLAHPEYSIKPDYAADITVVHLLIETAKSIITYERSLDILAHVWHGRDLLGCLLPSWVPDWTSKPVSMGIYRAVSFLDGQCEEDSNKEVRSQHAFASSGGRSMDVEFQGLIGNDSSVKMRAKGIFIERLSGSGGPLEGCEGFRSIPSESGHQFIVPISALEDDEIWILYGAKMPVVVRPEGDEMYGYLGEALVVSKDEKYADIMFGAVVEKVEQGTFTEASIWII